MEKIFALNTSELVLNLRPHMVSSPIQHPGVYLGTESGVMPEPMGMAAKFKIMK